MSVSCRTPDPTVPPNSSHVNTIAVAMERNVYLMNAMLIIPAAVLLDSPVSSYLILPEIMMNDDVDDTHVRHLKTELLNTTFYST